MNLSKFSDEDLQALKAGDLKSMSMEGLMELKRQQAPMSIAEQNLKDLDGRGPIDDLKSLIHDTGTDVKAGYAGVGDLVAGNGLDQATDAIDKVEHDKLPTTPAANLGSMFGGEFTPAQIAIQAALGKVIGGIAPWISDLLKGWGEKAALNAVGMMKAMADKFGLDNLEGLAQFLLKPITLGGETFKPIVSATSDSGAMLAAAKEIQAAAGKMLESVSARVDEAIPATEDMVGGTKTAVFDTVDLPALKTQVETLRNQFSRLLPGLGKPVIEKYQVALGDIEKLIERALTDGSETVFADLSEARTRLGELAFEHTSKMESTVALQKIYWAMSDILNKAASKTNIGADYAQANLVYHQASAVVAALAGKATKFAVKDLFAPGAGGFLGSIIGGLPGLVVGTVAGAAGNAYGRQAVARGLNAAAPAVKTGLNLGLRSVGAAIPIVGSAISAGLRDEDQ